MIANGIAAFKAKSRKLARKYASWPSSNKSKKTVIYHPIGKKNKQSEVTQIR